VAKLAPGDLAQVLGSLPRQTDERVIVGFDTADDAGVFRLDDRRALVQTVDFFTPVADDPEIYGRIAAVNALNDVYAMGGRPLTALSIVCYPQKDEMEVLGQILKGGQEEINRAGAVVIGGHSVDDAEMKFGYAVTGIIDPAMVVTNAGAKPGDVLILTKPIGTGAINTAIKHGKAPAEAEAAAIETMLTSAAEASRAMMEVGVNACTDVTGFGLLGHAFEMARASGVTMEIESTQVPLLPGVLELISIGMLTRGDRNNRTYVGDDIEFAADTEPEMQSALFDPQTAGGLLISVSPDRAAKLLAMVASAIVIGRAAARSKKLLKVT
jgi:selenide, water dikinase